MKVWVGFSEDVLLDCNSTLVHCSVEGDRGRRMNNELFYCYYFTWLTLRRMEAISGFARSTLSTRFARRNVDRPGQ